MSDFKQFASKAARLDYNLKQELEAGGENVEIPLATENVDGLMSKESFTTLNTLGEDIISKAEQSEIVRLEGLISALTLRVEALEDEDDLGV